MHIIIHFTRNALLYYSATLAKQPEPAIDFPEISSIVCPAQFEMEKQRAFLISYYKESQSFDNEQLP